MAGARACCARPACRSGVSVRVARGVCLLGGRMLSGCSVDALVWCARAWCARLRVARCGFARSVSSRCRVGRARRFVWRVSGVLRAVFVLGCVGWERPARGSARACCACCVGFCVLPCGVVSARLRAWCAAGCLSSLGCRAVLLFVALCALCDVGVSRSERDVLCRVVMCSALSGFLGSGTRASRAL